MNPNPERVPPSLVAPSLGWWGSHPYTRHSVGEVEEFIGWGKLLEICQASGQNQRNGALPAFLFETGCRVSEAIQLRRDHFEVKEGWVRCLEVPIVKQKISKASRTFSFPRDEPLWENVCESYLATLMPNERLFPMNRTTALLIVKGLGKKAGLDIWAHWFRAQRASQIGAEYRLTENDLMEWFKVKDRTWARRYCKKGDWGLRKVLEENKPAEWRA